MGDRFPSLGFDQPFFVPAEPSPPMADTFEVEVDQAEQFQFDVSFPGKPYEGMRLDEPEPLGEDAGPNAARMLGAAVGNCLSASLVFCLRDSDVELEDVHASVEGTLVRNEDNRLRIGQLDVTIDVAASTADDAIDECLDTFEDFCVVTGSVRTGLDVNVDVNVETAGDDPLEHRQIGELEESA